jgi:hypothetical protein
MTMTSGIATTANSDWKVEDELFLGFVFMKKKTIVLDLIMFSPQI